MVRAYSIGAVVTVLAGVASCGFPCGIAGAEDVRIVALEPTPLFPKAAPGEPLSQIVRLKLASGLSAVVARVKITVAGGPARLEELGRLGPEESVKEVRIPDVIRPTPLTIEVTTAEGKPLAARTVVWQPQKKWKLYCVSYCHQDLGFGDYPHRLRTTIRHANISRPLQFCRDSDDWDEASKFRFMIETSEPITSFLGSRGPEVAEELGRRFREGRIELGALHNTANTEHLGYELMARLFYLSNRHARDLLGSPKSRTAQIDDVIGLTWPLATFCAEADVPYFFHGPNPRGHCFGAAADEPVFHWQGPSPGSRVLVRSMFYGGYMGDSPGDLSEARVQKAIERLGAKWPYHALLLQEGTDFRLVTMDTARRIHAWNARWAYPRLICATMSMFFDDLARQAQPGQIKAFAGDGNDQWADQDANDAWALGQARRLAENIPTAEKLSTVAQVVAGGGNSWVDLYQAYHRLLTWHEHTNAIDFIAPELERMRRYETELEENREMVRESGEFAARAQTSALRRIAAMITRESDRSLIVFNPLIHVRTDAVRTEAGRLARGDRVVDTASGEEVPWQTMPDGSAVFVAKGVPPLGYKTFLVLRQGPPAQAPTALAATTLENRFFRLVFDRATGTITSIRDKQRDVELVDQAAPHRFNEYLYERFETSDWKGPTAWHRVRSAVLEAWAGPVAGVMQVTARPVGVEKLTQTVVLYAELPRIDFTLDLLKSPSGRRDAEPNSDPRWKESLYIALPLAFSNPQVRHELPGCVAEPVRDLFDGANTAFYAVQHFSDLSNGRYGVTVSATDSALVQYDRPRSTPIGGPRAPAAFPATHQDTFERVKTPIATGRVYLYLMNNMFDVNVRWDQAGPAHFAYALRSHDGDWQRGNADQFGWDTANPLTAVEVRGKNQGTLPAAASFAAVDQPNVECTTLKPAEINGSGFVLRLAETQGRRTVATVSLPLLAPLASATAVNLVEDDRPDPVTMEDGDRIVVELPPYGVRTVRLVHRFPPPAEVTGLAGKAVSDMEVALAWRAPAAKGTISHYHVYRSPRPDFRPGLLNLVQSPAEASCLDRPELHYGGWINNRLEPATTYYYRVAAVDRWNREGPASPPVPVATLKSNERHLRPLAVQRLSAIGVSPLSRFNVVNLLWRSNCESGIVAYEVHRSTVAGFEPTAATRIAVVDLQVVLKGGGGYGHTPIDYRLGEFDHQMYLDTAVQPATTYYYRVCAVDAAGQKGLFSPEVQATTR